MSCTTKCYVVIRNGKLTKRIQNIIAHYRKLGVNIEFVLENELNRLKNRLLFAEIFGTEEVDNPVAKIRALEQILDVLNS